MLPHSAEEVSGEIVDVEQNVTFHDLNQGESAGIEAPTTVLTEAPMTTDMSLQDFMSRPIKIRDITWPSGGGLIDAFNPWELYFGNKRVINRINNFKLMQADLHVKVLLNGTPFHFGGAMMNYLPLFENDDYSNVSGPGDSYRTLSTQRPMVFLNPTTSQGGEITCPFFFYKNAMDIVKEDWKKMGIIVMESFTDLKHASDAPNNIDLQVFAWATNVRLSVPTHANSSALVPQSDEYTTGSGPISKPASIVANVMARFTKAPWIGPYARATEIGASAVAAIASVFGYSRPALLDSSVYRPITKGSIAVTNMPDDVAKLSVDCKQELTIDSRTVGLSGGDELDIHYIASRPAYLTQFVWSPVQAEESLLWNCVVTPLMQRDNSNGSISMTPMAFASLPFKKWRGSIKFHFKILASAFHRGRVCVTYDPESTRPYDTTLGEYNTAQSIVVDMAETTEFDFVAGWGQATTYRDIGDPGNLEDDLFSITPLFYNSSIDGYGNGTVSVRVATKLVTPDSTIDNNVTVLCWVSAGDDFELAMPNGENVNRLRASDPTNPLRAFDLVPHSIEETAAATTSLVDATNHVHFGECIRSFRQLLKRYSRSETIEIQVDDPPGSNKLFRFQRSAMPLFPGYYTPNSSDLLVPVAGSTNEYVYGNLTLLRYLASAYVGWRGATRVVLDAHGLGCCKSMSSGFVTRYSNCTPTNETTTPNNPRDYVTFYDDGTGMEGAAIMDPTVNGVFSFEVPYYSEYRFTLARQPPGLNASGPFNTPCWKYLVDADRSSQHRQRRIPIFYAAGEDFTLFHYLGPPPMWIEGIPPVPS
jgi:hypothetical protein